MMRAVRAVQRIVVLAAVLLAGTAASASASTVARPSPKAKSVVFTAAPGERNDVTVVFGAKDMLVRDTAGLQAGAGCRAAADGVHCAYPQDPADNFQQNPIRIRLRDGDDRFTVRGIPGGKPDPDGRVGARIDGGPGNDVLIGSDAEDTFVSRAEPDGADVMRGGAGDDLVTYEPRRTGVVIDLDGRADDGAPGEHDDIADDVEAVRGGHGADRLIGNDRPNIMSGEGGTDRLSGGAGDDALYADQDGDVVDFNDFGARTADVLDGGAGDDLLRGSAGPNRLRGGPGNDELEAGPGDDTLLGRDGRFDGVFCGSGRDTALLDEHDFAMASCDRIRRTGPAVAVPIGPDTHEDDGTGDLSGLTTDVACPADVAGGRCRGTLAVHAGRVRLGRARLSLRRSDIEAVTIHFDAAGRRYIRRKRRLKVYVVARTRLPHGSARSIALGGYRVRAAG